MDVKYGARVPVELFLVPLWHTSVPDEITINNQTYPLKFLNSEGSKMVFSQGIDTIINAMTTSSAGEVNSNCMCIVDLKCKESFM